MKSCRHSAMDLLARREHSRLELAQKLNQRQFADDEIESVLDALHDDGLQSDARFAEMLARQRVQKGYGPLRIQGELQQKGVDSRLIQHVLGDYEDQWQECLQRLVATKYAGTLPRSIQEKAKRARFLYSRGFPSALIHALWRECARG